MVGEARGVLRECAEMLQDGILHAEMGVLVDHCLSHRPHHHHRRRSYCRQKIHPMRKRRLHRLHSLRLPGQPLTARPRARQVPSDQQGLFSNASALISQDGCGSLDELLLVIYGIHPQPDWESQIFLRLRLMKFESNYSQQTPFKIDVGTTPTAVFYHSSRNLVTGRIKPFDTGD